MHLAVYCSLTLPFYDQLNLPGFPFTLKEQASHSICSLSKPGNPLRYPRVSQAGSCSLPPLSARQTRPSKLLERQLGAPAPPYLRPQSQSRICKKQWPESLPSMVWGYSECAICLQAYKPGQTLKLLSCSHAFHGKCIDLWHCVQPSSKTCPLCVRGMSPSLARQTAGTGIPFQT
uniref:RING-type domain-containing protein n=1 Tax=Calidris pygmaea TaxID=425635 RepID=A0A8C3JTB3_9CHAR